MIVGLLIISFFLSFGAAVIAKLLGATILGSVVVYVGFGTLSGLGLGVFSIARAMQAEH